MEYLIDHNADVAFTIETWLKSDKNKVTADIKSYGYTLKHNIHYCEDILGMVCGRA